ncbi:MAG: DoxX family protein [Sphingopyxis sp.]|nr:DoxX family protein [Sphingopyxis sp.]
MQDQNQGSISLPPWLSVAARAALASAFLLSAVLKVADFPAAVAEVRALTGIEPAALVAGLVIAVQLGGSALLLLGGHATRLGAMLLGGFTLAATLVAHDFWNEQGDAQIRDMTVFFEHMGLIGGFILAASLAERTK